MRESNPNSEFTWRHWRHDAGPALGRLRFREARISRVMADAQSAFAAANLADIQDLISAPAAVKLGRSRSGPDMGTRSESMAGLREGLSPPPSAGAGSGPRPEGSGSAAS